MTKKTYLKPTAKVVEVKIAQLVCASLNRVASTGLDKTETLDYGDEDGTTEKDAWGNAW
jgi:hypothetical protein